MCSFQMAALCTLTLAGLTKTHKKASIGVTNINPGFQATGTHTEWDTVHRVALGGVHITEPL